MFTILSMAPSFRHNGVQRISGYIPDSTVQVRVGTHGSNNGPTHDPTPQDKLSSFSTHYTNIRGLNFNFSSVETHLSTSFPNLFLLSKIQQSSRSSPDPFQISHYSLFSRFRSKGSVCAYCNINTPFVVTLDIAKAFDRVWLKALLAKLPAYGFTPSFCKLISSVLSNRFISVVVVGSTSASFPVSSGVPQGSVLSPTLFLLFINDLLHASVSDAHSFADDSALHKSSFQCQPSSNAHSQSRLIEIRCL